MESPEILASALPFGGTPPQELDHWPKMTKWAGRRFGAIKLRAAATNNESESRRLLALCAEIDSRHRDWRARFFEDLETCSWVQIFSEGKWRSKTNPIERLQFLIDRVPAAYSAAGTPNIKAPRVISTTSPRHSGDVFPVRAPDAPLPLAPVKQRSSFEENFAIILRELEKCWPEMSDVVAHHIKAVSIVTDSEFKISSNRYYPGILFLREGGVEKLSCEDIVHEALHQSLFCLEGEGAFQLDNIKERFKSVWSGNELNASVYFHLPVVYFGLFMLYDRLAKNGSTHRSDERADQIGIGLRKFFAEEVGDHWLTPRGHAAFQEIKGLMKSHWAFH